jgi:phage-related tail fiber protein
MAVTKISLGRQTNLNANGGEITNVGAPTQASSAATKAYVDGLVQGVDWKASVRAATTGPGTLASAFANGSTIDGVTLATGDRILIKDQASGAENGIYVVAASGAPTRAADADAGGEITGGMAVFVEEGTTNADTGWLLSNNGAVTIGTTALTFVQFTSLGSVSGGAGLTKTGNTLDVVSANGGIVVNADNIALTAADASLTIGAGGVKVTPGTGGQFLVTNGSGVVTPMSASGDVQSISATGAFTLASTVSKNSMFVTRETPTGTINGSNTAFTLANTPVAGTEEVFLNGILQEPGAGNDYTISGATITYLTAPVTGDKLVVNYRKSS